MSMKSLAEQHGSSLFLLSICLLVFVVFMTYGCGSADERTYTNKPPATADQAWLDLKPIVQANCGGCHNGTTHPLVFDSGAKFKASKAKAKLVAGLMPPPPAVISADAKAKMLTYLN